MSETAEKKKKIYKVATELNLSHETLVEFLRKKGHAVKNHMSSVDDDMMRDILLHFKKEKDVAEKHHRKIAEIRESKKREPKKEDLPEAVPVREEAPPKPAEPSAPAAEPVTEPEPESRPRRWTSSPRSPLPPGRCPSRRPRKRSRRLHLPPRSPSLP